ncbi:MAG: bifunctional precorrin-2 dehydrogenase/sirohydrochlorin ferrochelatase [Acidobacteriaceae bacterium]
MNSRRLFPLFLKLDNRKCLVVGGTSLLVPKIQALTETGASVRVVATELDAEFRALAAEGRVSIDQRRFEARDLEGVVLVIAADRDQSLNEFVSREAQARGVLCNVVAQPALCQFYYPAIVRRGQLQIAISTGGSSPSLASAIRADLEQQFHPEYAEWVAALGAARDRILRTHPPSERRTRLLKRISTKTALQQFRSSREARGKGAI